MLRRLEPHELKPGTPVLYLQAWDRTRAGYRNAEIEISRVLPKCIEIRVIARDGKSYYRNVSPENLRVKV